MTAPRGQVALCAPWAPKRLTQLSLAPSDTTLAKPFASMVFRTLYVAPERSGLYDLQTLLKIS